MLLEMSRPLNYLGAQALHFFQPFGTVLIEPGSWETFANFLERRGSVEYLARLIEDVEAERVDAEKADASVPADESATSGGETTGASASEDDSNPVDTPPDHH
jgi:hypothetical protein